MQPQSENSKSEQKAKNSNSIQQQQLPATTTATAESTTTATTAANEQACPIRRNPIKVIKCKKPLCHFVFYLDIRDHQLTNKIESQINALGGSLEFFLTPKVTHFVTDKTVLSSSVGPNNNTLISSRPGTPQTPATRSSTPQTTYSFDSYDAKNNGSAAAATGIPGGTQRRTRQSRADAILNRVRRQSSTSVSAASNTTTNVTSTTAACLPSTEKTIKLDTTQKYLIWQTDYALRFFKKVQHELKDFLGPSSRDRKLQSKTYKVEPISLKGGFIKVESRKYNYRPYYQVFRRTNATEWPKIELSREEGAFRLSPKKSPLELVEVEIEPPNYKMTRKSRSRSSTQHQRRLPTAVQSLKKPETTVGKTSTGQRHSNMGAGGACCKQAKESSDKQCGVCEICKIEYDTLTIHLKTKDHEYFAKNSQNFIALDTLINSSADVNKFLDDENKRNELKSELEEMEVEEDMTADVNVPDPLEDDPDPLPMTMEREEKRRSSGAHKTPSPSLREKSKRSTKGKHSSEKFRNATVTTTSANSTLKQSSKSPKIPPKAASPQKKPSSSMLELQHIETASAAKAVSEITPHHYTRRKPSTVATTVSPPIRAMLPPSSLYKVVETPETCPPTRKVREAGGEQAVASPSLIVKFKKVRQAELFRLNGEAENFMFPKRRTSSELATDVDRQTTSDNVRVSASSTSLDTTSSELMDDIETDIVNVDVSSQQPQRQCINSLKTAVVGVVDIGKRAIATAKRQKGRQEVEFRKQSFPIAPIQPEIQLKRLRKLPLTKITNAAATTNITLPEATRKSSRTATAIVTAATTSSRLLRAAVEAAKYNNRRNAATICNEVSSLSLMSSRRKCASQPMSKSSMESANIRRRITVVKMEDGMGDNDEDDDDEQEGLNTDESDNDVDEDNDDDEQDNDDEDEESDDEQEDDDDDDEDYIHSKRVYYKHRKLCALTPMLSDHHDTSTRKQRAARRELRKCEMNVAEAEESNGNNSDDDKYKVYSIVPKKSIIVKKFDQPQQVQRIPSLTKKSTITPRLFDYTKSDRLNKSLYAFERLPAGDLWYRVFKRQDTCEERYYEYFGSTKYQKLPYELGPIPFDRTIVVGCSEFCKLCVNRKVPEASSTTAETNKEGLHGDDIKRVKQNTSSINNLNEKTIQKREASQAEVAPQTSSSAAGASSPPHSGTGASSSNTYKHKHKKLHLLQRYREEQQELLQKKQPEAKKEDDQHHVTKSLTLDASNGAIAKCDSKASTPDRERLRASSTHSNASSCASSSTTTMSKQKYRNKHLNKAAFLSLELPPRKSPREHASTLALVSCLIKQRQDSESKPNSEIDEPPATPTSAPTIKEETKPSKIVTTATVLAPVTAPVVDVPSMRSPRNTRSAAATPVEELRFTTEISENVKRMRRGQNKYDHSPPIVLNSSRASRGRRQMTKSPMGRRIYQHKQKYVRSQTPNTTTERRHYKRKINILPIAAQSKYNSAYSGIRAQGAGSVRKTGSKKGVLEFEMDTAALKTLDASTKHTNVRQLEWEIDKYLQLMGKDYDMEIDVGTASPPADDQATTSQLNDSEADARANATPTKIPAFRMVMNDDDKIACLLNCTNTPPATDCFSSDFDLYDLVTSTNLRNGDDDAVDGRRKGGFSLYNSVALHNYFRKRKNLKSNRTGWPKVQKKKSSRQQQLLQQKIRFSKEIGEKTEENVVKQEPINDESTKHQTREDGGVITPPDSEIFDKTAVNDVYEDEDDADETELDAGESIPEEDDAYTMADSVDDEHDETADDTAVRNVDGDDNADADEEYDDDDVTAEFEDAVEEEEDYKPASKRARHSTIVSPIDKVTSSSLTAGTAVAVSSTSAHLLRGLRRTPQINGSLGSCISPSEKAGDNSDIFTVSSDGLDTDVDLSNSHSQHKVISGAVEEDTYREHHCANPQTPKRKFDLSKYATNNAASSTCAAEAATAAVKSLAISQFLKKEVRVNCRRLRTPFRRFRYRR